MKLLLPMREGKVALCHSSAGPFIEPPYQNQGMGSPWEFLVAWLVRVRVHCTMAFFTKQISSTIAKASADKPDERKVGVRKEPQVRMREGVLYFDDYPDRIT